MPRVTTSVDGLNIERVLGRFSGTFELEEEELGRSALDTVVVGVVVAQVKDFKVGVTAKGEIEATRWFRVGDFRVVDDELREALIDRLNLIGADTLFAAMGVSAPPPRSGASDDTHMAAEVATSDLDPDGGEPEDAEDEEPTQASVDRDALRRRMAENEERNEPKPDGPRAARFDGEDPMTPDDEPTTDHGETPATEYGERETLGSVYGDNSRKDKHLERFMADSDA